MILSSDNIIPTGFSDLIPQDTIVPTQYYEYGAKDNTIDYTVGLRNKPTGASVLWGNITGSIASQSDLQTALNAKVSKTQTITAGTGLSGGGDLSVNRTLSLANTAVTPGTYNNLTAIVDAQGRIISASNGTGALPSAKAVYAYSNTAQTIAQNTFTAVNFNQEKYDTGNYHDNTTNNSRITVPGTGYWYFKGRITFDVQGAGTTCSVLLVKNGSAYYDVQKINASTNNGTFGFEVSALIDVVVNDFVEIYVQNVFGGNVTTSNGTAENFFQGYQLF